MRKPQRSLAQMVNRIYHKILRSIRRGTTLKQGSLYARSITTNTDYLDAVDVIRAGYITQMVNAPLNEKGDKTRRELAARVQALEAVNGALFTMSNPPAKVEDTEE